MPWPHSPSMLIRSPSAMARSEPSARRSGISGRFIAGPSRERRSAQRARSDQQAAPGGRFLIDNSVWARLAISEPVRDAFRALVNAASPTELYICPPVAVEYGYSSRTGTDHTNLMQRLGAFTDCPFAPTTADVLRVQNALWNGGLLRAVGSTDTLIAAYAIANEATLVHYDRDFEHVAAVTPGFAQRWIVPRGTL